MFARRFWTLSGAQAVSWFSLLTVTTGRVRTDTAAEVV